ncbi:hypothetical protein KS4_08160 [Poriferisphaera corsica]|uniref:Uncharacterized protein n=1 Tax=Poriferisphaera corsica TaxID=2528020 RepID=A0A517YRD4_9BACT|nr:hypothetical protein [Poriferisphaera corsica]QDU32782.1 hypothetical protein KS4_08160 [Poriferisphaera corsica]
MKIVIEPQMCEWEGMVESAVGARDGEEGEKLGGDEQGGDDDGLVACINANADRLGTGRVSCDDRLVVTGHQAWFWHPGILAKDIAGAVWAEKTGRKLVHLVVDHDVNAALRLQVPVEKDGRLYVQTVRLGKEMVGVSTGWQGVVDVDEVLEKVGELDEPLRGVMRGAWERVQAADCRTLAEQVGVAQVAMMEPYVGGAGEMGLLFTSDFAEMKGFDGLVEMMVGDAARCVRIYNEEVRRRPEAGVGELVVTREFVELPLWGIKGEKGAGAGRRMRVFADVGDSREVVLVDEWGEVLGDDVVMMPKALMMTWALRSGELGRCDLFIHGTGGGIYDGIMESWWLRWCGKRLAPMAVVTADLYLDFDVPNSGLDELEAAVWWAHHVVHNVERVDGAVNDGDGVLVEEKRELLGHMDDDRDRRRRRAAFKRIHTINDELVKRHGEVIEAAETRLAAAKAGVKNRAIAGRRDWCFGLYDRCELKRLREMIAGACHAEKEGDLRGDCEKVVGSRDESL